MIDVIDHVPVLLLKPNDADVLQTKLFLLLQTEQYAPAFELASATTGIDLDYQRAYSMYRLNQEAEAASLIGNIKQRDLGEDVLRGVDILDAQLVRPFSSSSNLIYAN